MVFSIESSNLTSLSKLITLFDNISDKSSSIVQLYLHCLPYFDDATLNLPRQREKILSDAASRYFAEQFSEFAVDIRYSLFPSCSFS